MVQHNGHETEPCPVCGGTGRVQVNEPPLTIHFAPRFREPILTGNKRVTIRQGRLISDFPLLRAVEACFGDGTTIQLFITGIEIARLCDLSLQTLRDDGFDTVEAAVQGLREWYPALDLHSVVTAFRFTVLGNGGL